MSERRARLASARVFHEGDGTRAEVQLEYGSRSVTGESGVVGDEVQRVTLAALAAAEALVERRDIFLLNVARPIRIGDDPVVLVTATLRESGQTIELLGVSHVADGDVVSASARAALDAVNRYLELVLPPAE